MTDATYPGMAITSRQTAIDFAMSIVSQGADLQAAIDAREWNNASDILQGIESDRERLDEYVNVKLIQAEENR